MKKFITFIAFAHATFASSNDEDTSNHEEIVTLNEKTKLKVDHRLKTLINPNLITFLTFKEALDLACTNKQIYNDIDAAHFQPCMKQIQEWELWMKNFQKNNRFHAKQLVQELEGLKSLYFAGAKNEEFCGDRDSQYMQFTVNGERLQYVAGLTPIVCREIKFPNIWRLDLNEDGSIELVRQPGSCRYDNGSGSESWYAVREMFSREEVETLIIDIVSNVSPFQPQFLGIANQMREKYGDQWSRSGNDAIWKEFNGLQDELLDNHIVAVDYIPRGNLLLTQHKKIETKNRMNNLLNKEL